MKNFAIWLLWNLVVMNSQAFRRADQVHLRQAVVDELTTGNHLCVLKNHTGMCLAELPFEVEGDGSIAGTLFAQKVVTDKVVAVDVNATNLVANATELGPTIVHGTMQADRIVGEFNLTAVQLNMTFQNVETEQLVVHSHEGEASLVVNGAASMTSGLTVSGSLSTGSLSASEDVHVLGAVITNQIVSTGELHVVGDMTVDSIRIGGYVLNDTSLDVMNPSCQGIPKPLMNECAVGQCIRDHLSGEEMWTNVFVEGRSCSDGRGKCTRTTDWQGCALEVVGMGIGGSYSGPYVCHILKKDGSILCVGSSSGPNAGFGNGEPVSKQVLIPVAAATGVSNVTELECCRACTAVTTDNALYSWGAGGKGEIGNGETVSQSLPTMIYGPGNVRSCATAAFTTCCIMMDGFAKCWGDNAGNGQLGMNAPSGVYSTPQTVSGSGTLIQISAGYDHMCAVYDDFTVRCWGNGQHGKLGNGGTTAAYVPTTVSGLSNVKKVSVGTYHSCALSFDGSVRCWGHANKIGDAVCAADSSTPVVVARIPSDIVDLASHNTGSCVLSNSTGVWCWGEDISQNIYSMVHPQSCYPEDIGWFRGAKSLQSHGYNALMCALMHDGTAWCWGNDFSGALGLQTASAHYRRDSPSYMVMHRYPSGPVRAP